MAPKTVALLAVTLTFLTGCGGPPPKKMVTVTGTVNYNGQPVMTGVIKFLAPNGDFATAAIAPDGKFIMTEVTPGVQKVAYVGGPSNVGSSGGAADGAATKAKPVAVPSKFGEPQTSGATVTVPENGGEVTVELK